ncbi:MAG: hypothetical protein OHK0015_30760 [Chloroflexi bacterium OHK40]
MEVQFVVSGELWYWRGPAPHYFIRVPEEQSRAIHAIAALVTYGWGVIPVRARIGQTTWMTSLFPKDGRYLVPIRATVRRAEQLEEGAPITVHLEVGRA